jgi:hypothetical protein
MPHGFFTIEQFKPARRPDRKPAWVPILHLNADQSVTAALAALQRRNRPGLYRIIQTQRQIWAEATNGKLRLRQWHANSPAALTRTTKAFTRDKGHWPGS